MVVVVVVVVDVFWIVVVDGVGGVGFIFFLRAGDGAESLAGSESGFGCADAGLEGFEFGFLRREGLVSEKLGEGRRKVEGGRWKEERGVWGEEGELLA